MDQFRRLAGDGFGDGGVCVPQAVDPDAGDGVQVAATLGVKQVRSLTVGEADIQPLVGIHQCRGHAGLRVPRRKRVVRNAC